MNIEVFKEEVEKLGISLTDEKLNQLALFYQLLSSWNEKMNLTRITNQEEVYLKHFYDSLTLYKEIKLETVDTLCDVGSGAGFPGIPIKIYREDTQITLLDSLNKRVLFLQEVINKLDLKNIEAIHGRAEEVARNNKYREKFDVVTSRAVANMSTLTEYMIPFIKIDGLCIMMKGSDYKEELEKSQRAINLLGAELKNVEEFILPDSDINRSVILIDKVKSTPKQYPRKAGMPSKYPIS